jgi:DNA polymerase (family 10)
MSTAKSGGGEATVGGLSPGEIAARLRQASEMLRLRGESRYRAGAYEMGAEVVEAAADALPALVAADRLTELRGIGPSLTRTIQELAQSGRSDSLDEIMGDLPAGLLEVARVPGLTLRRLRALHEVLGIESLGDLERALAAGAVETVPGFGPATASKLRDKIREALARAQTGAPPERRVLVDVIDEAARLASRLRRARGVMAVEIVGSVRRWAETVGDLNLLAASDSPEPVLEALCGHAGVAAVEARAPRSCRVRLVDGLRVTLVVEPPERFAAALVVTTGSAAHVRRLEERAGARGLTFATLGGAREADVYAQLGLPDIPPELREDAGEIEAADAGDDFADLITERDIRGMVHCHSLHSDGKHSIAQMAGAAAAKGMEYITITDHSASASYAGGLTEERLRAQWPEIAAARAATGIQVLRGTESDILKDGRLDFSDDVLGALDVVIASVHERHKLDREAMTARIVRAIEHPRFKIWGHALGRLLLRRDPIDCDVERILDTVARSRAAIEVNGSPWRLDLAPEWIRSARRRGTKFVISVDAHSTRELDYLRFGVSTARRGGLRRSEVLNTLPARAFADAVRP